MIALAFADDTTEDGTFHNGIRKVWFLLDMTKYIKFDMEIVSTPRAHSVFWQGKTLANH